MKVRSAAARLWGVLGIIILISGTDGSAQEAGPAAPVPEDAAPEAQEPRRAKLDEIIVTANKRSENIQDVPLSISAIGGDEIKEKNIADLNDLALYAPNMDIVASPTFNFISMRGIVSGFNKGFEQSVATVIDEVYYGRASYLSNGLLDLAGVEILRGPQGTLFGKNSVAGALHIKTGDPEFEWGADAAALIGEYNERRYQAMVTGPVIADTLAFRIAAQHHTRDGDITNTTIGKKERNIDRQNARAKLLFEPTGWLSILATVNWSQVNEDGPGIEITGAPPEFLTVFRLIDPQTTGDPFDGKNHSNQEGFAKRDNLDFVLKMEAQALGHTFTSITAYGQFDEEFLFDVDFTPVPYLVLELREEYELFSQEFRVTSDPGEFEYVGGLHYFATDMFAQNEAPLLLINDAGGLLADLLPGPLGDLVRGIPINLPPIEAERRFQTLDQQTWSFAAFGQATWHALDNLALTVGARWQIEVKEVLASSTYSGTGLVFQTLISGSTPYNEDRKRTEINFSPKVSLQYYPVEEVMTYVTIAKGFKGGGFSDAAVNAAELEFEGEESITYEAGVKATFLGGAARANLSGFRTDFNDLQLSSFNGQRNIVRNAANAVSQGVEFELSYVPFLGAIISASGAYIDATFKDFPNGVCISEPLGAQAGDPADLILGLPSVTSPEPCDLSGGTLPYAPKFSTTINAGIGIPLGNWPVLIATSASLTYSTTSFFSTDQDPIDSNPESIYMRGQIGLADIEGLWSLTLFVENLTDKGLLLISNDIPTFSGSHFGIPRESRRLSVELRVSL